MEVGNPWLGDRCDEIFRRAFFTNLKPLNNRINNQYLNLCITDSSIFAIVSHWKWNNSWNLNRVYFVAFLNKPFLQIPWPWQSVLTKGLVKSPKMLIRLKKQMNDMRFSHPTFTIDTNWWIDGDLYAKPWIFLFVISLPSTHLWIWSSHQRDDFCIVLSSTII